MKHNWNNLAARIFSLALLVNLPLAAAGIAGRWRFVFETPLGPRESVMDITVNGEEVKAKSEKAEIRGTFKGDQLQMSGEVYSSEGGYSATLTVKGTLDGDEIKGEAVWSQYTMAFSARREKGE